MVHCRKGFNGCIVFHQEDILQLTIYFIVGYLDVTPFLATINNTIKLVLLDTFIGRFLKEGCII